MNTVKSFIILIAIGIIGIVVSQLFRQRITDQYEESRTNKHVAELDNMKESFIQEVETGLKREYIEFQRPRNQIILDQYLDCVWKNFRKELLPFAIEGSQPPKGYGTKAAKIGKSKCEHLIQNISADQNNERSSFFESEDNLDLNRYELNMVYILYNDQIVITKDTFDIKYLIKTEGDNTHELEPLIPRNLHVIKGPVKSTHVSIINGVKTTCLTYDYSLRADAKGEFQFADISTNNSNHIKIIVQ